MLFHENKLYICLWRVLQIMTRFNMYVIVFVRIYYINRKIILNSIILFFF